MRREARRLLPSASGGEDHQPHGGPADRPGRSPRPGSRSERDRPDHQSSGRIAHHHLHGRTRAQGYTGQSQLPQISNLPLPIIANGDLTNIADIERVEKLGYSGAMLGRAMLGKPWIFGQICQNIDAPQNVGEIVLKHLDLMIDYYGAKVGIPMFRKHVMWYSAGMPNSAQFRIKINQILDEGDLKKNIKEFWHVN